MIGEGDFAGGDEESGLSPRAHRESSRKEDRYGDETATEVLKIGAALLQVAQSRHVARHESDEMQRIGKWLIERGQLIQNTANATKPPESKK